ncbi:MAG TPA: hypothetical protein VN639_14440 [Azonexus sp.]|nr:hypothetical protein [Azonexus sp.]
MKTICLRHAFDWRLGTLTAGASRAIFRARRRLAFGAGDGFTTHRGTDAAGNQQRSKQAGQVEILARYFEKVSGVPLRQAVGFGHGDFLGKDPESHLCGGGRFFKYAFCDDLYLDVANRRSPQPAGRAD